MSELGLCSRREADQWIAKGWIKVDRKIVNTLGVRVSREVRIEVVREATAQHDDTAAQARRLRRRAGRGRL